MLDCEAVLPEVALGLGMGVVGSDPDDLECLHGGLVVFSRSQLDHELLLKNYYNLNFDGPC